MTFDIPSEFEEVIRSAVASGEFKSPEDAILRALQLLTQEQANVSPSSTSERQGGQWKGQIQIADDFSQLPTDMQEAFGMGDQ